MSATTKKAAPGANQGRQSHDERNPSANDREIKQGFIEKQDRAEHFARQLIHSWAECGITTGNECSLDWFPNETLREIAETVRESADHGIRGFSDLMATAFLEAPEGIRNAFIDCCEGVFPPRPDLCRPLVEHLRKFHVERRTREILDAAHRANETGEPIDKLIYELRKLDALNVNKSTESLPERLKSRAFDFESLPEKPVPIFRLCDHPLATPGNVENIQALPKAGKSAVVESMIAATLNGNRQGPDTLGFSAENIAGHALIHFDTEQSRFDHDALIRRACRRAVVERPPSWFRSYTVADLDIHERRAALKLVMEEQAKECGGVFAVMIDGIGDLCGDPNDSEEAFGLVHELHALAITHNCAIVTVLHENPGSESGKTRGHLGSQLERKAETNLRLAKDKDGITTIWAERARHCYLPKDQGPCFSWNDQAGMHTSCGTAGEIKSAAFRGKMESEAEKAFGDESRLSYTDLTAAIMDALTLKERAATLRVRKWSNEGIIRKDDAGKYSLNSPLNQP